MDKNKDLDKYYSLLTFHEESAIVKITWTVTEKDWYWTIILENKRGGGGRERGGRREVEISWIYVSRKNNVLSGNEAVYLLITVHNLDCIVNLSTPSKIYKWHVPSNLTCLH